METCNGREIELDNVQPIDIWEATFPNGDEVHFWITYELDYCEYWAGWAEIGAWRQTVAPLGEEVPSREEVEELYCRLRNNPCDRE